MTPREKRSPRVKTTLYWEPALRDALKRLADADDRSMNEYLVRLVRDHVKKETER